MKKLNRNSFGAILTSYSIICALLISVSVSNPRANSTTPSPVTPVTDTISHDFPPCTAMCFSLSCVTEEYEYDDAFAILYNDPDINAFDEEIFVDYYTYSLIIQSHIHGDNLTGALVHTGTYTENLSPIYTFEADYDF